jgi:hypothetical protein
LLNAPFFSREDIKPLSDAVGYLEYFIAAMSSHLLPELKDHLKISGFYTHGNRGGEDYVIKSLICYAFPSNLEKLRMLTDELKQVNDKLMV